MDQALFERWRNGDSSAVPGVRNGLRGAAMVVLSDGRLSAASADQRREDAATVGAETMEKGAATVPALFEATILGALSAGISRRRDPEDNTHGDPAQVIQAALGRGGPLPSHLTGCRSCTEELRILRIVLASLAGDPPPDDDEDAPTDPGLPRPGPAMERVVERVIAQVYQEVPVEALQPAPVRTTPSPPRSPTARPRASAGPESRLAWAGLAGILVLGAVFWAVLVREPGPPVFSPEARASIVALADRSAPPPPREGTLPGHASSALRHLVMGDCSAAAKGLRAARLRDPEVSELYLYEAGAWLCAGSPAETRATLTAAETAKVRVKSAKHWLNAQIALLEGDGAAAAAALELAVRTEPALASRAQGQLERLQTLAD